MNIEKTTFVLLGAIAAAMILPFCTRAADKSSRPDATKLKDIKAYCIDLNWEKFYGKPRLARPGAFGKSDPAEHFAWCKMMGVNVIQTFCVSTVGYAWYRDGFVPEQPGLQHDYLREMVKLGHAEGMCVFGYFTIGSNPRWSQLEEDQNYGGGTDAGISGGYHVIYTDEYLEFLAKSITDAVSKTEIDGFMIDWLWQPTRNVSQGKWIEEEKALYKQLMGVPYPGDEQLTEGQELAYSRKALTRAWKVIRKAAKDADPKCIVWLTVNKMDHEHMLDSEIYQEVDWLMNEAGDMERIHEVKEMVGEHTRLITCMAAWTGVNATEVVPQALKAGVGLYGFSDPKGKNVKTLAALLAKPVWGLKGEERNIATLARAYNGVGLGTVRNEKGEWVPLPKPEEKLVETETRPNVVVITADDMAWTDSSMVGSQYASTPNLQKLAHGGAFFPRGYVPTPWSRASLMTLITGRYAHEHGTTVDERVTWGASYMAKPTVITTVGRHDPLPKLLGKAGYVSFQSGRWFEGDSKSAGFTHGTTARGAHSFDSPGIGEKAIKACTDFIDMATQDEKPFLLWYAPALPSFNYHARAFKYDLDMEVPEAIRHNQRFILGNGMQGDYLQFQRADGRHDLSQYYSLVEWFDAHCGELIDHLEMRGLRENTLIVVQSANGWVGIRRRGSYAPRTKGSPFDGGVRAPVIVSWPAKIKPLVSDALVSSVDVVPTILAATGTTPPRKALPGTNLLPVMAGTVDVSDRAIFGEIFDRHTESAANPERTLLARWVIQKQYKLIVPCDGEGSYDGGGKDRFGPDKRPIAPQLFDLVEDPYEQTNLYGKLPKVAAALRDKLDDWYTPEADKETE